MTFKTAVSRIFFLLGNSFKRHKNNFVNLGSVNLPGAYLSGLIWAFLLLAGAVVGNKYEKKSTMKKKILRLKYNLTLRKILKMDLIIGGVIG